MICSSGCECHLWVVAFTVACAILWITYADWHIQLHSNQGQACWERYMCMNACVCAFMCELRGVGGWSWLWGCEVCEVKLLRYASMCLLILSIDSSHFPLNRRHSSKSRQIPCWLPVEDHSEELQCAVEDIQMGPGHLALWETVLTAE